MHNDNIDKNEVRKKLNKLPHNLGLNIDTIIKQAYKDLKNRGEIK